MVEFISSASVALSWLLLLFCVYASAFVASYLLEVSTYRVALRRAARLSPGDVTPSERTDHVLSDDQESRSQFFGMAARNVIAWTLITYAEFLEVPHNGVLKALLLVDVGLFAMAAVSGVRYVRRGIKRERLVAKLRAECLRWDPSGSFAPVVVIHTDRCTESVLLFDALTRSCYARGVAVMQYPSFAWPRYVMTENRATGNVWVMSRANPQIVLRAVAGVWLDFEVTSESVAMEVAEARETRIPLLRFSRAADSKSFAIADEHNQRSFTTAVDAVAYVGQWLTEASAKPRQKEG